MIVLRLPEYSSPFVILLLLLVHYPRTKKGPAEAGPWPQEEVFPDQNFTPMPAVTSFWSRSVLIPMMSLS